MKTLPAVLSLVTAVSCGDTRLYEAVGSALLEGTWTRGCHLSVFPESSVTTFPITERWVFSGSSFTKTITTYDQTDPSCSLSPIFAMQYSYTLSPLSPSSAVLGAKDLNLSLTRMTKTPLTAAITTLLNDSNSCGLAPTWANGTETEITGKTCSGTTHPSAGTPSFDLVQVSGDQLTIGDTLTTDGVNATRPTSLHADAVYARE